MPTKQTRAKRKASGVSRGTPVKKKPAGAKAHKKKVSASEPIIHTLPPAWRIAQKALLVLWQYRVFFVSVTLIYLLLDLVFVRSVVAFDASSLKSGLDTSLTHGSAVVLGGLSVFASLFTAAATGASADATGAYHFFLVLFMSLVIIWSFRMIFTEEGVVRLRVKQAFYNSTTPLVPFLLLVCFMGIQFIPLFIGLEIYALIVGSSLTNSFFEQTILMLLLVGLFVITLVWLARTIMALYIVTLPDMEPVQALKKAKLLVAGRRLSIIRKLLFLPLVFFVIAGMVIIPCILVWAPLAQWLFFVLSGVGFVAMHAYLYTLYRELLV